MKSKLSKSLILIVTVILAGIAIFTAFKLYQLRQQTVAPNAPSSIPQAASAAATPKACQLLAFSLTTSTPSVSPTPTVTASPTPTPSPTPTITSSPTSTPSVTPSPTGTPNICNGTCGSNANCQSGLICYNGFCRTPSCQESTSCVCATTAATPTPQLPESGTNWPSVIGISAGGAVVLLSLLLAL